MSNVRVVFLLLVVSVLVLACDGSEEPVPVDMSKRQDVAVQKPEADLTYAYLPQYSHRVSFERHHLLVDYLQNATGLTVRQVYPDTFDEHMTMVGQGLIDISFSNPFVYVKINRRYGAEAFARIVEPPSRKGFRSQIICRSDDASVETVDDCRGKRWLAVDPSSAGGYLFALGLFLDHGLTRDDFAEVAFAPGPGGKQEKVVLGVHSGKFDIGSIREGTLSLMADRIDLGGIRVLAQSRYYPGWVYAAKKGLPADVLDKVKRAMLALDIHNPAHRRILEQARFTDIIPASDADFDPVRELARRLEQAGERVS